jgi:hypothetical protein
MMPPKRGSQISNLAKSLHPMQCEFCFKRKLRIYSQIYNTLRTTYTPLARDSMRQYLRKKENTQSPFSLFSISLLEKPYFVRRAHRVQILFAKYIAQTSEKGMRRTMIKFHRSQNSLHPMEHIKKTEMRGVVCRYQSSSSYFSSSRSFSSAVGTERGFVLSQMRYGKEKTFQNLH